MSASAELRISTVEPIVPVVPYGAEPPARPTGRGLALMVSSAFIVVAVLVATFVHLPYMAIAPGSASSVSDLFTAPTGRAYPPKGQLYLTTISLVGLPAGDEPPGLRPLEALRGWIDQDIQLIDQDLILQGAEPDKVIKENREQMTDSQILAKLVAFRRLGYPVEEHGEGGRIMEVAPDAPAAGKLSDGDVVVGVNGVSTETSNQIIDRIQMAKPGDRLQLTVEAPQGEKRLTDLVVGSRSADGLSCFVASAPSGTGQPCIGVSLGTKNRTFDFPFDVTIDSGRIGGPSAGLAFTLGLLDYLTPGELTGGNQVAVTGTIGLDGRVGEVGGVYQKTVAAMRRGVDYFLVPPGEFEAAKQRAGSALKVISVETLDDALEALSTIGGDLTALGPPAAGLEG